MTIQAFLVLKGKILHKVIMAAVDSVVNDWEKCV